MDDTTEFERQKIAMAAQMAADQDVQSLMLDTFVALDKYNYTYQSSWLGLPIIQSPSDIVAQQEIIWACRPTVIIETGVARGGSMIFLASMLQLVDGRRVIGVDIDIRTHNRSRIEQHVLASMITLIEGSSTSRNTVDAIRSLLRPDDRIMVVLDSNHQHHHVLEELEIYGPWVTPGQYLVVADTIIEFIPPQNHRPRPWGPGNNPLTAVASFQERHTDFVTDRNLDAKLALSCNPRGYLRREPSPIA
jgi:cephalosporin hydroxylase